MSDAPFDAEIIIVGSGAAGAAAAFALRGRAVLMVDVGYSGPATELPSAPISRSIAEGVDLLPTIFDLQSATAAIGGRPQVSVKFRSPLVQHVTRRPPILPDDEETGFVSTQSFSRGGLANVWGAGVMPYTAQELQHFPVDAAQLNHWVAQLTGEIGISGSRDDDLAAYFGSTEGLLPPHELCPLGKRLLSRYERRRKSFHRRGIRIGRPRLAILSEAYRGRPRFEQHRQEFFAAGHEGIYSPRMTVDRLVAERRLQYRAGVLVERFEEHHDHVTVFARDLASGAPLTFRARELLLAAGTLNTTRIVLRSRDDRHSMVPILDNPVAFLPVIDPWRIGAPMPESVPTSAQLTIVVEQEDDDLPVQGSIYNLMGPLRSDLLTEFPLTMAGNLVACRELLPAMLMVQLFYPDRPDPRNTIALTDDGGLRIRYEANRSSGVEHRLARHLLRLGLVAPSFQVQRPIAGSSIHYAGTLPMRRTPAAPYETSPDGVIAGYTRIRAVDASVFPVLPAKNHTLMLMANSARIAATLSAP
jgi:choline dehydrogenase-like flavoprotein